LSKTLSLTYSRRSDARTQVQPTSVAPVPVYHPPTGFEKVAANEDARSKVEQVFGSSNMTGKQLWYITAPASVPISAVKQVSLENVHQGKSVLSLNGQEYGFVQDQTKDKGYTKIMVPNEKGTMYRIGKCDPLIWVNKILIIS
jgi:hypothetical protein